LWLVVLTDLTAVAFTTPPSKLTCSIAAELVAATPVSVVFDAAVVSIVPDESAFGTCTEAAVFECVTPIADVQPSMAKADLPDFTVLPTRTWDPQALAWNENSGAEADAVENPNASAANATPLNSTTFRVRNSSRRRRLVTRRSSRRIAPVILTSPLSLRTFSFRDPKRVGFAAHRRMRMR
jgi:hypothetical protein